jgi:hypothetical protein
MNQLENDDFSRCSVKPSDDVPDDDNGVNSLEYRFCIYCDALCQINERGSDYFSSLIWKFPEWAPDLTAAVSAWKECAAYGGFLWSQGLSFDEAGYEKFRRPEIRKILADEGRRSMKKDMEAIGHIENILRLEETRRH